MGACWAPLEADQVLGKQEGINLSSSMAEQGVKGGLTGMWTKGTWVLHGFGNCGLCVFTLFHFKELLSYFYV